MEGRPAPEFLQSLGQSDPLVWERKAEELLDRVLEQYADFPYLDETLGSAARRELFELRHLGVGRTAPEIEGEDLDGKKFKLSDYRGKVVVLDFGGYW
jgi:hypothetical protein